MTISDSSTSTSANKSEPCFFSLLLPQIMCCSSSATIFSVSLYLSFCLLWPGCLNCALTPFTVISLCTLSLFLSVNCISLAIGPSRYSLLAQLMISSWLPLAFTVPRHELPSSTYFRSLQIRATSTKQPPPPPPPPRIPVQPSLHNNPIVATLVRLHSIKNATYYTRRSCHLHSP